MTPRLAKPDDLPALAELDPWPAAEAWQRMIGNDEVLVLPGDDAEQATSGGVLGLIHYTRLWADVPFLNMIVLAPHARGKGYSRVLLDDLVQRLRAQGYAALLSSSQTDEPEPQAWHVHMGFTSNGIIENIADEGIGEVVFRLILDSDADQD